MASLRSTERARKVEYGEMTGAQPPLKQVGDGKGRRGEDPERSFQWYTPKKRRATLYEDVTIDTQPSVHRHLDRGWPVHFASAFIDSEMRSTACAYRPAR